MTEPSGGGVTPTAIPETTPPQRYPMTDYSFTLQAVMELQKAVGGLTVRIDELIGKVDKQADRLNSISHQNLRSVGCSDRLWRIGRVRD